MTLVSLPHVAALSANSHHQSQTPSPFLQLRKTGRSYKPDRLIDYYCSSTFNMCEQQPVPMMEGPPMQLMIDPEATPVAHHKVLPVPLHWWEEIKGLIRMSALVSSNQYQLERWSPGATKWLSAQKKDKPRKTVDLQALNLHATCGTMHETVTTVFSCMWMSPTSLPSFLHGAATAITLLTKDISPQAMDSHVTMTR